MRIRFSHSISKVSFSKSDTHDVSHLTVLDRFRKNVEDVHLRTSEDLRWKTSWRRTSEFKRKRRDTDARRDTWKSRDFFSHSSHRKFFSRKRSERWFSWRNVAKPKRTIAVRRSQNLRTNLSICAHRRK